MPGPDNQDNSADDLLSPEDISRWAEQEIKNARRALDLRVKELSQLAAAYSEGKLTPEQADEAHSRYYHRWGEALPGATASDTLSDDDIIGQIDKSRRPFVGPRQSGEQYRRLFKEGKSR